MDLLMCSSPIPASDDGEPPGLLDADEGVGQGTDDSTLGATSQANSTEQEVQFSSVSHNERTALRWVAEKLKLHPYQRTVVQDFIKVRDFLRINDIHY